MTATVAYLAEPVETFSNWMGSCEVKWVVRGVRPRDNYPLKTFSQVMGSYGSDCHNCFGR